MDVESLYQDELVCVDALYECLLKERDLLVLYRTDALFENNARKEILSGHLKSARVERRRWISDEKLRHESIGKSWMEKNERVADQCISNQCFIERSIQRQNLLMENLRKLMGGPSVYSNRGNHVEGQKPGRVD